MNFVKLMHYGSVIVVNLDNVQWIDFTDEEDATIYFLNHERSITVDKASREKLLRLVGTEQIL